MDDPLSDPNMRAQLIAALIRGVPSTDNSANAEPAVRWNRAGAKADEAMGFNALQRATGLNLSPRVGVGQMFQPELAPQNRISEAFRRLPGYF